MEIILNWICLGRYYAFTKGKKIELEEYVRSKGVSDGLRTVFCEEEIVLTIPAAQ